MQEKYDLIIKGGLVVGSKSMKRVDIGVKDGKISVLSPELKEEDAAEVVDAAGHYVLPGLLDVHVHPVYVDTVSDCSLLGAFGGITTMIHYAYAHPGKGLDDRGPMVYNLGGKGERCAPSTWSARQTAIWRTSPCGLCGS